MSPRLFVDFEAVLANLEKFWYPRSKKADILTMTKTPAVVFLDVICHVRYDRVFFLPSSKLFIIYTPEFCFVVIFRTVYFMKL